MHLKPPIMYYLVLCKGIADLITRPGLINVDFADVRTVMSEMGMAMMGTGVSIGENRAQKRRKPLFQVHY